MLKYSHSPKDKLVSTSIGMDEKRWDEIHKACVEAMSNKKLKNVSHDLAYIEKKAKIKTEAEYLVMGFILGNMRGLCREKLERIKGLADFLLG